MSHTHWMRLSVALAAILGFALTARAAHSGRDVCDPGLAGSLSSALGYSMRGDRCEGLYALQVNSSDIRLASLVETFELDSQSGAPLTVRWTMKDAQAGPVRLRAQSLGPRSYYRMDTATYGATGHYTWPTEILGAIGLKRHDLGALGWFEHDSGGERREVYLPLRIAQSDAPARKTSYEVALIPDIRLREITLTLVAVDALGVEGETIIEKKLLDHGYYPAKQATIFHLPKPDSPGFYRLELVCDLMPTGIATTTFWLYHSE